MEYVSPFDERVCAPEPAAERPASVAGRTIALLDISKARGAEFLDRLEHHLQAAGARTFRIAKPAFSRPAPVDVIEEIALRGDLTVEGLAD
jgi:hypothetical protein